MLVLAGASVARPIRGGPPLPHPPVSALLEHDRPPLPDADRGGDLGFDACDQRQERACDPAVGGDENVAAPRCEPWPEAIAKHRVALAVRRDEIPPVGFALSGAGRVANL